jgi:tetratricopeptide (TPR) repeat protein
MSRHKPRAGAGNSQKNADSRSTIASDAFYETALRHMRGARYLDAQISCEQALAVTPAHADTLHLMGILCFRARQFDQAVQWFARAIRQDPRPEYLSSLGNTLQQQLRHEEALQTFDKAIQLKPDDAKLWRNLGNVLADLKRPAEAVLSLQHALKLDPQNWDVAEECGILLHGLGKFEEAYCCFGLCDELRPNRGLTLYMRGRCLTDLKRFDEALVDSQRAHLLDPTNSEICNGIGNILQMLGRHEEALKSLDKALELQPNFVEALNNKGTSLGHFHRFEEALSLFDQALELQPAYVPALVNKALMLNALHRFDEAIAVHDRVKLIDPGNADAEWNLSHLYLLTGNFEAGWVAAEARWRGQARPRSYPNFIEPRWFGEESIAGKTVLIYGDEGLGDSIQFARYVPMVAARGARIILVVGAPACSLLSRVPGVVQCLSKPMAARSEFDFHCPISSLPLIFGTRLDTIPSGTSFLPPIPANRIQSWEERLGPHDRLRVGLVWSGSPTHKNDHNRSISLRKFSPLLDADATFISLQKDPKSEDKAALLELTGIIDLTSHLSDFAETAALISCLDLVITVDTSVAHLAGALGCRTWILLPYTPDYRWLLDREDSPWYPTARLFRQSETREYGSVIERVRSELQAMVAYRHNTAPAN